MTYAHHCEQVIWLLVTVFVLVVVAYRRNQCFRSSVLQEPFNGVLAEHTDVCSKRSGAPARPDGGGCAGGPRRPPPPASGSK